MAPKRILFDTDPGIDDSLAILLALASPELKVEGVSVVHGNCSAEQATANALAVLELARESLIEVSQQQAYAPIYVKLTHGLTVV